jgi:hypothetical protein
MRAAGKKIIAAQATAALWAGIEEWQRRQIPRKSITDFLVDACIEKLINEKIPFDLAAARFDGRIHNPDIAKKKISFSHSHIEFGENSFAPRPGIVRGGTKK